MILITLKLFVMIMEMLSIFQEAIPYHRDHYNSAKYKGHLGIYGFTKKSLNQFCSFNASILEETEKLEQLRAISNSAKINMVEVSSNSFGIDTKEDLENALKFFTKE